MLPTSLMQKLLSAMLPLLSVLIFASDVFKTVEHLACAAECRIEMLIDSG